MNTRSRRIPAISVAAAVVLLAVLPAAAFTDENADLKQAAADRGLRELLVVSGIGCYLVAAAAATGGREHLVESEERRGGPARGLQVIAPRKTRLLRCGAGRRLRQLVGLPLDRGKGNGREFAVARAVELDGEPCVERSVHEGRR